MASLTPFRLSVPRVATSPLMASSVPMRMGAPAAYFTQPNWSLAHGSAPADVPPPLGVLLFPQAAATTVSAPTSAAAANHFDFLIPPPSLEDRPPELLVGRSTGTGVLSSAAVRSPEKPVGSPRCTTPDLSFSREGPVGGRLAEVIRAPGGPELAARGPPGERPPGRGAPGARTGGRPPSRTWTGRPRCPPRR